MSTLGFIAWLLFIFLSYKIAEDNNRNTVLAVVLGAIFGIFAVIGYWIIGKKEG